MLKNSMKSFVMSMKRMCYMVGTRRRLKRYGVMSPMCLLLNMYSCAQLQSLYHGIPRCVVEKFVSLCPSCQLRKPQLSTPPLKPIIANGFFCRLQVSKLFVLDLCYNTL